MTKRMIDIIDSDGNKVGEIRSAASSTEVANMMRKPGASSRELATSGSMDMTLV